MNNNKNYLRYVIYDFCNNIVFSHHNSLKIAQLAFEIYKNKYKNIKNLVIFDAIENKIL